VKFCPNFKIISRRWILSQGNRGYKNQSVRKMAKIMTLVILEIHEYVHLLKTLFSFSSFRSARSDAFLRSIGAFLLTRVHERIQVLSDSNNFEPI